MILTRLHWSNFMVKKASIHEWPQRQFKLIVGAVVHWHQSYKSGRAFRVGFGPKVDKNSRLIRAWDVLFVLGAQKYNQNNLATLLNFQTQLNFLFFLGIIWASN